MAELASPFAMAAAAPHEKAIKSVKLDQANGQKECAVFVNGAASPRSPSPAAPLFSQQKATELLDALCRSELANLVSTAAPVVPPKTQDEVAAWAGASQLIRALDAARSPGGARARTIAARAAEALETALRPLLRPDGDTQIAIEELPAPISLRAMANLAAQAALWVGDDGAAPAAATETLLHCAEQCTALGSELGPCDPAGQYALQLALAVARNLKLLSTRFPCSPHIAVDDVAARMHLLLMASAGMAEHEWDAAQKGPISSENCGKKVSELWGWALERPVDENGALSDDRPAQSLTRVWTEAAAVLLGAAWCTQPAEVRSAFIPLATASSEREGVLLLLGRLLAVVGGEESAARLLIPVVMDTLAAKGGEMDAAVYGVAAHVLASMAASCAASDSTWGYTQVVDLLIKLYKFPLFSISAALMYGTASGAAAAAAVAAKAPASLPGAPQPQAAPQVRIAGRCPGALARALEHLAAAADRAPLRYRKDLRLRLLSLFSDFCLLTPNESFVADLGALLPAVAAAARGMRDHRHEVTRSSMSLSLSGGDLSLDALSSMQAEGRALNAALRHLWLHASIHDFAGVRPRRKAWPAAWAGALAEIAATTPALLIGSEQLKAEAFLEGTAAAYGRWLDKMGPQGQTERLMAAIVDVEGAPPGGTPLPAPLAAHVLTIAYKAVVEATYQAPPAHPPGCCPLEPVLTHMQLSLPTTPEYAWMKQALVAAFSAAVKRLGALAASGDNGDAAYAASAVETTAEVLTGALKVQGPNEDVAETAGTLLESMTDRFPALLFSPSVFAAAVHAVAEQEGLADAMSLGAAVAAQSGEVELSPTATVAAAAAGAPAPTLKSTIPRQRMLRLVRQAAEVAPGPAEALVLEMVRHLGSKGSRHASLAMQFTAEVMAALHAGRSACPLPDLSGSNKGLMAWTMKIHALGTVEGLAAAEVENGGAAGVGARCARSLLDAVREGAADKALVARLIEAAAAVVRDDVDPSVPSLLRLLAWTPLARFVPGVVSAAIMTWYWLLAVGSASLKATLIEEISAAWVGSCEQKLGLFDRGSGGGGESEGDSSDDVARLDAIRAHHAWVVFFAELWASQRHDSSSGCLALRAAFGAALSAALGGVDASPMSLHPLATGARFRLLQLALGFVSSCERMGPGIPTTTSRVGMYRRIVATGLEAFNAPVAWYETDRETLRESAAAVRDFSSLLRRAPGLVAASVAAADPAAQGLREAMGGADTELLLLLLPVEADRLALWADPVARRPAPAATFSSADWTKGMRSAWALSPRLALALGARFAGTPPVAAELQRLVTAHASDPPVQALPAAARYLATAAAAKADSPALSNLASWAPVGLAPAMAMIASDAGRHPSVVDYVIRSLSGCDPEELGFFLPQMVQLLRNDPDGALEKFLLDTAAGSVYFAYLLVCQLDSEGTPPEEAFNPAVKRSNWEPPQDTGLWTIADRVRQRLWDSLKGPVREKLEAQLAFFESVTAISGKLYPVPKEERKAAAVRFVREVRVPRPDLFMPTDLHARVVAPKPESAAPMQSAAKCPILVAFDVDKERVGVGGSLPAVEAAIFKVGDDCRQDVLALQVISLLKDEFDAAALPLPLVPYGVIPTGHECGIIEVVPHAKSRAQLGELTDGGLFDVFQREFGLPGSPRFEAARAAFIRSSAAYAVASYLLQAKDRHNGNIMVDNHGRIIHIDFGYILGISPGGNMGFESAAFKLSYEMTELLDPGNTRTSPHFLRFQELCVKGYLAARSAADAIVATVAMAEPSKLPCFGRGTPVQSLKERFHLEMSDAQAAEFMRGLISDAYDKWTTGVYDIIQYYQNKIAF